MGYPRIDRLLRYRERDKWEVAAEMGLEPDAVNVLYAPTYNAGLGFLRNPELVRSIVRRMSENDMNLILRPHPYTRFSGEWKIAREFVRKFENVHLMDMLVEPDTEKVLHISDLLVTDWSSIYTDYLVLDRPVVFLDVPHPRTGPGFIADLPQDARPGPVVSQEGLIEAVEEELESPNSRSHERKKVLRLAHGEPDGKASERVYNFILKFIQ